MTGTKLNNGSRDPDHASFKGDLPFFMLGLEIAYLCTKFGDCSLRHSRDMIEAHQNLNGSLSGIIAICGLALATIRLSTKFEVSIPRLTVSLHVVA